MTKRFTETDKWRDKWYRALRPEFKLAWQYICDNCDAAGVIDVDFDLAEFQIGIAIDWKEFLRVCGERITQLKSGKWWIVSFVGFQYGVPSRECRAHIPVFQSLERNGILDRVLKGYSKGIQRDKDLYKDKDKDRDKDKDLEGVQGKPFEPPDEWDIPPDFDTARVRELLEDFAAMRSRIKKPIRSRRTSSAVLKHFADAAHLEYALELCIANEYQGLKPEYKPPQSRATAARQPTFTQMRVQATRDAVSEFVNNE